MLKQTLSSLLSLTMLLLLFNSCQKDDNVLSPSYAELSPQAKAEIFLRNSATLLPFAILDMNHETRDVKGILFDKTAKIRKFEKQNASYLIFDKNPYLSQHIMEVLHNESEVIGSVDLQPLAEMVKISRNVKLHDAFTTDEAVGNSSRLMLIFNKNPDYGYHSNCGGGPTQGAPFNIIILSANGQLNYESGLQKEQELVNWLRSFEDLTDN